MDQFTQGGFTLPGEAGYESLTLQMAKYWGADVIRDSDGTKLSQDIVDAGYQIYSTICIIREHNEFAMQHPETQQQCFLSSDPVTAASGTVTIDPLAGYFDEQFQLNDSADALPFWQVWDRTENRLVPPECWSLDQGKVTVRGCTPWHRYTVSFLCWRIWEEINMYNHTTNHWTSEHLRQLDPRHPLAWEFLQNWLRSWCENNPDTDVVRLTSLFYNFVWIFGDNPRRRTRFTDWASYDFTVSPAALRAFEQEYGYALTAEDFIHQGRLQATHRPPTAHKRDYMAFISRFVAEKAKVLVDIIHAFGKKAYVFYDDSWVGMEPYGDYFASVGFDGLIKCVFSGFECRLCAGVDVPVHELRFHPYLFPVGLGGLPTFSEGGHPEKDAMDYWLHVRRALARQSVDRIGLGGYLHLTEDFPDFQDYIETISDEFRELEALHESGKPESTGIRVGVLHSWGSLRPWTLSGHFHETYMHELIHVIESLAGLPVETGFLSFADVAEGALEHYDVIINAGRAGDAWSGGDVWKDPELTVRISEWVHGGGTFIGIGQPSAAEGTDTYYRLANILGVDEDTGARVCHGKWTFETEDPEGLVPEGCCLPVRGGRFLTDGKAQVLLSHDGCPDLTRYCFGEGRSFYLSGYSYSPENTRLLLNLITAGAGKKAEELPYIAKNPNVDCAYFPESRTLIAVNLREDAQETEITLPGGEHLSVSVPAGGQCILHEI